MEVIQADITLCLIKLLVVIDTSLKNFDPVVPGWRGFLQRHLTRSLLHQKLGVILSLNVLQHPTMETTFVCDSTLPIKLLKQQRRIPSIYAPS